MAHAKHIYKIEPALAGKSQSTTEPAKFTEVRTIAFRLAMLNYLKSAACYRS
jgi:hypothetical protein